MQFQIVDDCHVYVTRHADPDEEWDSDDIRSEHSICGLHPVRKNDYWDIQTDFNLKRGQEYYLVYALYSTGDSFHYEEGRIYYIDLFASREKADDLVKIMYLVQEEYEKNRNTNREKFSTVKYISESGKELEFYCGIWQGYFESLEGIYIETIRILED